MNYKFTDDKNIIIFLDDAFTFDELFFTYVTPFPAGITYF